MCSAIVRHLQRQLHLPQEVIRQYDGQKGADKRKYADGTPRKFKTENGKKVYLRKDGEIDNQQFRKCKFWPKGGCFNAENCLFKHESGGAQTRGKGGRESRQAEVGGAGVGPAANAAGLDDGPYIPMQQRKGSVVIASERGMSP